MSRAIDLACHDPSLSLVQVFHFMPDGMMHETQEDKRVPARDWGQLRSPALISILPGASTAYLPAAPAAALRPPLAVDARAAATLFPVRICHRVAHHDMSSLLPEGNSLPLHLSISCAWHAVHTCMAAAARGSVVMSSMLHRHLQEDMPFLFLVVTVLCLPAIIHSLTCIACDTSKGQGTVDLGVRVAGRRSILLAGGPL